MNCFRHRRNFSPSSCSESLPLQWQHRADSPSQLGTGSSRAVHVAQRCLHGSPRAQGKSTAAAVPVAKVESQDPHRPAMLLSYMMQKVPSAPQSSKVI